MKPFWWVLKTLKPRRLIIVVLIAYSAWLVFGYRYHFIDNVNLLVHEAGHVLFSPFGEVLGMLGGTILQLAVPLLFAGYFLFKQKQRFEASICGVWAAESAMYTAEYISDAQPLALPLIGGHIHDWRWFFDRFGGLRAADEIGFAVHVAASLALIAVVWSAAHAELGELVRMERGER